LRRPRPKLGCGAKERRRRKPEWKRSHGRRLITQYSTFGFKKGGKFLD
jgi:hypothetical protein